MELFLPRNLVTGKTALLREVRYELSMLYNKAATDGYFEKFL
jgi:hypothetical protein